MTVLVGARDEERGRQAVRTLADGGADAHLVPLDVTDEKSIRRAAEWIDAEYGRLDILVNNAGIVAADGTNAMLPLLRRSSRARIVNVSSEVGSITSMTDPRSPLAQLTSVPYPSSKTALNMVTAMYAKELRDTPIKVNAASPGYCTTDFNQHRGFRAAEQGAEVSVHLATLPDDGSTGTFWGYLWTADGTDSYGVLPW